MPTDLFIILLVIGVPIIILFLSSSNAKAKRNQIENEAKLDEAQKVVDWMEKNQQVPQTSTSMLLKKGERAVIEKPCSLHETRAVRHYQSGGAGMRVAKGVYIGGSKGSAQSIPEMQKIDTGTLILTNQRLFFDGSHQDRNIKIEKIAGINLFSDSIEVTSETRQKSMYFTVSNPILWSILIRMVHQADDPYNFEPELLDRIVESIAP
jgi:hypothetical protein